MHCVCIIIVFSIFCLILQILCCSLNKEMCYLIVLFFCAVVDYVNCLSLHPAVSCCTVRTAPPVWRVREVQCVSVCQVLGDHIVKNFSVSTSLTETLTSCSVILKTGPRPTSPYRYKTRNITRNHTYAMLKKENN